MGNFATKEIIKNLHFQRNLKKLKISAENGDAQAMEKIGIDFFRRVLYTHEFHLGSITNFKEKDEIDVFEGMLSAIYWFDRAVENGKIDSNYWIGETIDLYAYCGILGQSYYPAFFKEFLQSDKCKRLFQEVFDSKKGYLYKIFEDEGIHFYDREDFYKKAAEAGNSSAAFRLGEIYLNYWFNDYYNHVKYNEPLTNYDYLNLAGKYLHHAFKKREPDVITLIFKIFEKIENIK